MIDCGWGAVIMASASFLEAEEEAHILKTCPAMYPEWKKNKDESRSRFEAEQRLDRRNEELCRAIRFAGIMAGK
jgi:hypothetical protein